MTNELKVGIWGKAGAGKTTYLALLYHRFLALHETWNIYTVDEASRMFVEEAFEQIIDERLFPEKTVTGALHRYKIYNYQPVDTSGGQIPAKTEFELSFRDVAGELVEQYYHRDQRNKPVFIDQQYTQALPTGETPQAVFDHLKECQALLIFIDPADTHLANRRHKYQPLLYQFFEDLREYRRETGSPPPYVAFCLSKADGNPELWKNRGYYEPGQWVFDNDPTCPEKQILYEYIGEAFMTRQLPGLLPPENTGYFLVSAIGRPESGDSNVGTGHHWIRPETPAPPVFETRAPATPVPVFELDDVPSDDVAYLPRSIHQPGQIASYNLLNPLLWILSKLPLPVVNPTGDAAGQDENSAVPETDPE